MDLEIHRFKEIIIAMVNSSPLPLGVKRMAINEIASAVNEAANVALAEQIKHANEKAEEKENGNSSKKR